MYHIYTYCMHILFQLVFYEMYNFVIVQYHTLYSIYYPLLGGC